MAGTRRGSRENCSVLQQSGLHGSPGDATHRPETRGVCALLTMRVLELILISAQARV